VGIIFRDRTVFIVGIPFFTLSLIGTWRCGEKIKNMVIEAINCPGFETFKFGKNIG